MNPAFHYIVRVKLIRFIKNDNIDFINDVLIFENNNPIVAREKAFEYYNSYIDTLLEPNLGHKEVENKLSNRILGGDYIQEDIDDVFHVPISFFNGIGVILKINLPIEDDSIGKEYFIHGIGFGAKGTSQSIMDSLNFEMNYYNHYNYNTKNYKTTVKFFEQDFDGELNDEIILKTPYDWTGYDEPIELENSYDNAQNNLPNSMERNELIMKIIQGGESNQVEFKSSLVAYLNSYGEIGYSRHIKFKIVKTIASFLNSNGGFLFIGLKDDMSVLGLESDFSLAQSKLDNPKDYFNLEIDKIISEYFKISATNISGEFLELENKLIYIMKIEPSLKPVFIFNRTDKDVAKHQKEFYVRLTGASSILFSEIDEIVDYCINHWNKK